MVEKIKIGDKEYVIKDNPELLTFAESIRKEEKEKLRGDIALQKNNIVELKAKLDGSAKSADELEAANKQLKEMEAAKIIADNESKKLTEQLATMEAEKGKKLPKDKDIKSSNEELMTSVSDMMQKQLEAQNAAFETRMETMQKSLDDANHRASAVSVESHKRDLLAEHKGNIIPEFLQGATVEELNASLPTALNNSKKYITVEHEGKTVTLSELEKAKSDVKVAEEQAATSNLFEQMTDAFKKAPGTKGTENPVTEDVSKMNSKEFSENKNSIRAQLEAEHLESQKG